MKRFHKQLMALHRYGARYIFIEIYSAAYYLISFLIQKTKNVSFKSQRFISRRITHLLPVTERLFVKPIEVRRHLRTGITIEQAFRTFQERGVKYCILRWFEDLPSWPKDEDIDLLIAPQDIEKISDLFCYNKNNQAFDIYSIEGRLEYRDMPYYSYDLTNKLINRAILFRGLYRVPNPKDHFLALIYHVLLHKGDDTGIPYSRNSPLPLQSGEHDYPKILNEASQNLNLDVRINYLDLMQFLKSRGWLPPFDLAYKYAPTDRYLTEALSSGLFYQYDKNWQGEILVFIVREWAHSQNLTGEIESWFRERDTQIELLEQIILNSKEMKRARRYIRGGNWSEGPYPVSGGPPYSMLVFYDYHEGRRNGVNTLFQINPNYQLKFEIRDLIHAGYLPQERANFIHSSDNEPEAISYLSCLAPETKERLIERVAYLSRQYTTHFPVIKTLTSSLSRSKIELIDYHSSLAVKKTFRPTKLKHFHREVVAATELSKENRYFLKPLEVGPNYLLMPYIDNQLEGKKLSEKFSLIKQQGHQVKEFLEILYDQGYFIVDFHIDNLLLDKDDKIWVVDLEFLYDYDKKPSFAKSYNIVGTPYSLAVDLPLGYKHPGYTYRNYWHKVFRLN